MAETIFRADYRAPSHLIDTVHLEFDLDADSTSVINTMHVRPNPDAQHSSDLILNGETLTLVSVAVDGLPLDESRYTLGDDLLTIHGIDRECDVIVVNRFSPSANKALSGIYTSGQNLMSQCEAQGFRRITYFLDRPDVLSRYSVVIRASKEQYPVLLSNGNRIEEKDLDDGRHEARWEDPFPKPCYLFALVAGRLEALRDTIVLKDGRTASLEVWVEPQDIDKTQHTMDSLKKSIRWDEERWGLELDLDGFRIVATNDFNFGAMENKGLNIFNARYALANPKVATDQAYANIESVVGHEYFHNWTGDRVTLRDWFQLTLKEGLTVFRDQEFSADMLGDESARAVERIRNVITPEDTVRRIYINFCNPWSKNASSNKHRLTYPRQLIQYRAFLEDGGEIYFKTDDDDLFRDSLEYFPASGYEITWKTFDLHEKEPEWNIRTEHEGMFTEMGIKIKALIAKKLPGDETVTWIEPKVLKKMAAAAEAAAAEGKAE